MIDKRDIKINHTLLYILLFFCTSTVSSCKKPPPVVDIELEVSVSRVLLPAGRSSTVLTIQTTPQNQEWTISIDYGGEWFVVDPPKGTTIFAEITASENTTDSVRTGKVTVKAGKASESIVFSQRTSRRIPDPIPFAIELPLVRDQNWYVQHQFYAMEYDTGQRHSLWIAFVFNSEFNRSGTSRGDAWQYDPKIPYEYQWAWPHTPDPNLSDRDRWRAFPTIPGYDRGHLIASADRLFSNAANEETFYATNMSPHLPEFHQSGAIWYVLEGLVRTWARNCDTLYVVKGGAIVPGAPGTTIVERIAARNNLVVPQYYYMALVQRHVRNGRDDEFFGIAFWLKQYRGQVRRRPNANDAVTIRRLEELTGLNFFHNLDSVRPGLQNQVETAAINWARWPLQ